MARSSGVRLTEHITVRLPADEARRLERAADEKRTSRTALIRRAVREMLDALGVEQ